MNKELMEARKRFRGQKGKVTSGFDNSPLPVGKHTAKVVKSEIISKQIDGVSCPVHSIQLQIEQGDAKGRNAWPFPPRLDVPDQISSAARNIQAVLGDVLPGTKNRQGEFELDFDKFLACVEERAHQMIGELVEITIKDSNKNFKDDGTPFQSVYINRGLGSDKAGVKKESDTKPDDDLDMTPTKLPRRVARR